MPQLGKYNTLKATRKTEHGFYLTDHDGEEVLLPNAYVKAGLKINDEIRVFIYKDSEDRITATTLHPYISAGEFACLKVSMTNRFGAFLDWGLPKDLLCPFSEQYVKMREGNWYIVYLYIDKQSERLVASSKVNKFLKKDHIGISEGEEVNLLISGKVEPGYKCIINNAYQGLIFENETFQKLQFGQKTKGFVKKIRDDHKIDISLQKQGFENIEVCAEKIMTLLHQRQGFINLSDRSDPEDIRDNLQMSKKAFKKAIGSLYKQKMISIREDGIYKV